MSALTGMSQLSSLTTESTQPTQQPAEEFPKPSDEALQFLEDIDDDDYRHLLFGDALVTTSDTGRELGEFSVTIQPTKRDEQECFLIHANSHGAIDGVPCGTSITAFISKKLETLEQQHHEYVKLENHPLDRKTFIVKQDNGYVVNKVITQGEEVQRIALTFSHEHMQGFISEGSNLLLQRLLIKKRVPENLQLISFDSDTNLCQAVYTPLEERTQNVNGLVILVYGIERTINSLSDLPTTWQNYFTREGHLTSRVQVGSPVAMKLIRVPTPIEEDDEPPKPTFGKTELNWEEDMEMYSKFLDRKAELKNDHNVYMRHHPELKTLLADFMQFLLLRKPDDVTGFAAEYFSSFSTSMPDMPAYSTSAAPTPFPPSRANTKIKGSK